MTARGRRASAFALHGGVLASAASAGLLPWWQAGPGASLPPWQLAGFVLQGGLGNTVPRAVGLAPLLPALLAASWLLSIAAPGHRRAARGLALVLGLISTLVVLTLPGHGALGPGGWSVMAATAAAAVGQLGLGAPGRA